MNILAATLTVLSALVCLVWFTRHLKIHQEKRKGFVLTPDYPAAFEAGGPLLSVVVAAKDEEQFIERCARTMLRQDYPNFEMIVCNDRSTDGTRAIVETVAREDSRLRLVNIEHLPEGWKGKNNAMQTGIAASKGQWLCLIDADCRQLSRRTLSVAMQYAQDRGADFLSVLPQHELEGFWEHVVQPVGTGVMMIWFHPEKVNDPAKPHAYANGAFMLLKRSAYQAIGTHEAVKDCLNEDMQMAARAKRMGLRLHVVRSAGLEAVRMYTSLRQMVRGWSRIFLGTFGTFRRLTASLLLMLTMGVLPYAVAAAGLAGAALGGGASAWACAAAGTAATIMQLTVIYRFYALVGARRGLAWTYLLGCGVILVSLVLALSKLRKGAKITWRGTGYATVAGK